MRAIKLFSVLFFVFAFSCVQAKGTCDAKAKVREDFLSCTNAGTAGAISKAKQLYDIILPRTTGEARVALNNNLKIWSDRIKSDCGVLGNAFNDWSNDYSPDTDFQIAACRAKLAKQELEFYSWLACPGDIEISKKPKCETVRNIVDR